MKRYYTEQDVRTALEAKASNHTHTSAALEIGCKPQNLGAVLRGSPLYERITAWAGFRRVVLYERIKGKSHP